MESNQQIMERVKGAQSMADIIAMFPPEKRELARVALNSVTFGLLSGLTDGVHSQTQPSKPG